MDTLKDGNMLRELGMKLANFRKKLALAIGQKKITQPEFGEMFGGQTPRMMTSYERGEVDPPASMLYLIWKSGNSVDGIFAEAAICEAGIAGGARLYSECSFANLKKLDGAAIERTLREVSNGDNYKFQNGATQKIAPKNPHKAKASHSPARHAKKR